MIWGFVLLFAAAMLAGQKLDDLASARAFDEVAALVAPASETPPAGAASGSETAMTAYEKYAAVQTRNTDMVGWLHIEGTNIDYPVMQTVDRPDYYLKRGFDRQYSDHGVPYVAENCALGYCDNTVIYGHNMKDGTMFSDLCRYEDEAFYRRHKTICFDTLDGYGTYEIVAVFKTVAYSERGFPYYRFTTADDAGDFDAYLCQCRALALYDTGITARYGDKLLTLSTCEYSRENGRIVVVARRVDTEQ